MTCEGFNSQTAGNWSASIDGNYIEVANNSKETWTAGVTFDLVKGNKITHILGSIEVLFLTVKLEEVFGRESKLNVGGLHEQFIGGKFESITGVNTEIHLGPKYQIVRGGQKRLVSENQLQAIERQELIDAYKAQVGTEYSKIVKMVEDYDSLSKTVAEESLRAVSLKRDIGPLLGDYKDYSMHATTFKLTAGGDLKIEAGNVTIKARNSLKIEGGSVNVDGGGATLDLGAQFKINGNLIA